MKMLEAKNINAFYGEVQVLWDVSIDVDKGEIVAVMGLNGAGKTTLVKSILNLVRRRAESITFEGKDIVNLRTPEIIRLGIGYVPEGRRLFGNLTVFENLLLGAYVSPEVKRHLNDVLEWIFTLFPRLKERRDQLASSLSGGEQQMLAIARALIRRPKFLILDEPSLGLAPAYVLKVYETIKQLNEEGITMLVCEQYVDVVAKVAHRFVLLERGKKVLEGDPEGVLKHEAFKRIYLVGG